MTANDLTDPTNLIERMHRRIAETTGIDMVPAANTRAPAAAQTEMPLASIIDHTLLKPDATPAQIDALCQEALRYGFASVCVNPCYVARCARLLEGSSSLVCSVVGFPLGATTTEAKVYEARQAIASGAREIDMVLAIGWLKAGDYAAVLHDIAQVVAACHESGARCKVILETVLLTDDEKVAACLLAAHAGADFVKTSTGFAAGGATIADVALMRRVVGSTGLTVGVKASGGVRTLQDAQALRAAGATRIGASASIQIVAGDQR